MQRAMEKHVQTLGKVSGVRSENHVERVCFEPHSISHLCLSYSCSSVCTFADVVDPVNRLEWRRGRGSSRSCCHGRPGKSSGEGSASVFLHVRYVEREHGLGTSLHTQHTLPLDFPKDELDKQTTSIWTILLVARTST